MTDAATKPAADNAEPLSGMIDVHAHALLPQWQEAAARAQGRSDNRPQILGRPAPEWSEAAHLAMMDAHDIIASILSWPSATECASGAEGRDLARTMNETFADIVSRHPKRFGAFAVVPTDDPDLLLTETIHALDVLGLDGVSCTPQMQGYYLGDDRFDTWFAELHARKAVLFVHPSVPPGLEMMQSVMHPAILEFMFETTRAIANLVFSGKRRRFPDIRILCAHAGGAAPYLAHRMAVMGPAIGGLFGGLELSGDEVMRDLSSFYFDLTASTAPLQVKALRSLVDSSQLMLGFDFPMMRSTTIAPALAMLAKNGELSMHQKAGIQSANALRLLPSLACRLGLQSPGDV